MLTACKIKYWMLFRKLPCCELCESLDSAVHVERVVVAAQQVLARYSSPI